METLSSLIFRTIKEGAPKYNEGKVKECYEIYLDTTQLALAQDKIASSDIGDLLREAAEEASYLGVHHGQFSEAAWVLRHCFDEILRIEKEQGGTANLQRGQIRPMDSSASMENITTRISSAALDDENLGYWQDEKVKTQNDTEEGQCIADIYRILVGYLPANGTHKYGFTTYTDCFRGGDAVTLIASLGLTPNLQVATMKCSMFQDAGLIVPVVSDAKGFRGGNHLFRYGTNKTMRNAKEAIEQAGPHAVGTGEAALLIALNILLANETETTDAERKGSKSLAETAPIFGKSRKFSFEDNEDFVVQETGSSIATLSANLEKIVQIKDRKWGLRPKNYENCFIGSEAVTAIVDIGFAESRHEATQKLNQVLQCGLFYHVTREHELEDKNLFYRFTTTNEIQAMLDASQGISNSSPTEELRVAALRERHRQLTGLNIDAILNSFYGCTSRDGWDTLDLQNWRNNMKRWGFGRREDQDDEMVEYLAPLVLNVDPDTWDKSGDEEWESPWGILAQIAIFDQIPRSAFRGKKEAFKWDELAIRATRVAIEKGFFETAYKSTLNRFVVLLPLEHSESWEDQKLGVKLLLHMLSTVAIEDEDDGHTPYEIVKRLEFSKRLSTAFLEHAQVIAKFKRYPHRNRQHGRTTTLEERIWLASDLVPRWAKSQSQDESKGNKTVISLPVIPLKRLTRGR